MLPIIGWIAAADLTFCGLVVASLVAFGRRS